MKALGLLPSLALIACGALHSGSNCSSPLCGGTCCSAFQACSHDARANTDSCIDTCTEASQCTSGCCAPLLDGLGNPIGPFVCKAKSGAPYDCCDNDTTCDAGACCVEDQNYNQFCALACSGDIGCGYGARCHFDYSALTTCLGESEGVCGP